MKTILFALTLLVLCSANYGGYKEDDHCKEYGSYGKCKLCVDGYWIHDGRCIECRYAINWCKDCSPKGEYCFECEKGFYLTKNNLCGICMNGIANCEYCSQDGKECFKCLSPYELKYGKCYYNPYTGGSSGGW